MTDPLRKIAEDNVRFRKISGWISGITVVVFLPFFVLALMSDFQEILWIILAVLVLIIGFGLGFQYERKIIGKKTAVDIELERLKALHPEEKLELPKIEESELKLREMIRRSNRDDMV